MTIVGRGLRATRPWLFLAAAVVLVVLAGTADYHPFSLRVEYALRAAVVVLLAAGVGGYAWSLRHGQAVTLDDGRTWGTDLLPAAVGGVAGLTLVVLLNGTPYALGGLTADQTFRTAAITRFADTPATADFTFAGLPSFYAPGYFWVLGRAADLAGVEPWRLAKVGAIAVALLVPVLTYLLWRRLVPAYAAALLAGVPLLVQDVYQPYAWLVIFALVPWWLAAVHGVRRPGRRPGNPLLLGLIGAVLFLTYYYFFLVAALSLPLFVLAERLRGRWPWRQLGRAALVLAIAAAGSAVYWLPLLVSMVRAEHTESLANRWFTASHPQLPLPMAEGTLVGLLSLVGLVFLVWAAPREALPRGLLVLLIAAYGWYLLGAVAAAVDTPLLSFRGKPLVPVILLTGAALAAVRVTGWVIGRVRVGDAARAVATASAVLLVALVAAGQQLVTELRDSPLTEAAHADALPDGSLPTHHPPEAEAPAAPAAQLRAAIDDRYAGPGHPVVLTGRADLLALYPYWGFLQWNAHYAHPAADFTGRTEFVAELAEARPAEFARLLAENPYGQIDAVVLPIEGDDAVLRYADDAFPDGLRTVEVRFPRELFADAGFDTTEVDGYLVAVRPRLLGFAMGGRCLSSAWFSPGPLPACGR